MTRHRRFDLRFSLLQLVLIGFAVVTLPLGLALATAWVAVDHLASKATFAALDSGEASAEAKKTALENFAHLDVLSRDIYRESVRVVAQEVEAMQRQGSDTRQQLLWQATPTIPAVLLLTFIIIMLIARPMRQLDQAIRTLGDGRFDRPIQVSGLSDLADLGQRLNWLRLRLIELEEQKTFFLHHISHELKTPLTNIVEGAELLSQESLGTLKPEQDEILDIVRVNSRQLQGLIENLLTASNHADAAAVIAPRRIDLNDLIRKITDRHKLPARAKEIDLELNLSGETLWSDQERLGTIVDNLLSNAIKFTAARSRIRIVTGRIKNDIYIEVRDGGKGIRLEDHESVFERFFQQPSAVNSRIRGSGLGLFISREYAQALGGRLQVINSDKGACLQLRLPRRGPYRAFDAVDAARTSSQSV